MRALALALVTALLAAGCLTAADEPAAPATAPSPGVQIVEDRPDPTAGVATLGEAAAPDEAATLDAPPRLQVGEWWRIRTESPYGAANAEYVRVVGEVTDEGYVFGMPHEGWYKEGVIFHVPFFGDVGFDLSGQAHDVPLELLKFPLVDGATWKTVYMGPPELTATVDADEAAKTARVTFTDPDGNVAIELTYDAKLHEIVEYWHPMLSYEVLEHGYGFEGWVTVPRGMQTPILSGRIGPLDASGMPNPSTTDVVEVAGGYNRMSLLLWRGDIGLLAPAVPDVGPGVYGIQATDPAGNVYELGPGPMTGGTDLGIFESSDVDGAWSIDYTALGAGGAFVMGISYHQYDILLPSGEKRSDHAHPVVR
jgi:hypothetical protein